MSILSIFQQSKKGTASVAKERLKIIVSHERAQRGKLDFIPKLQQEILAVVQKYVDVNNDCVQIKVNDSETNSVLELNVALPDQS